MKTIGYIGVASGCLIFIFSFMRYSESIEPNVSELAFPILCVLVGALCIGLDRLNDRVDSLSEAIKKANADSIIGRASPTEETVDQLRREGMFAAGQTLSDEAVEEMLD